MAKSRKKKRDASGFFSFPLFANVSKDFFQEELGKQEGKKLC